MTEPIQPTDAVQPEQAAPLSEAETPEHRALVAEALREHADDVATLNPEQATDAQKAAAAIDRGEPLPYIVGTWGGRPNYECRWASCPRCPDATEQCDRPECKWTKCLDAYRSERAAAIHGVSCQWRPKRNAVRRTSSGGIS